MNKLNKHYNLFAPENKAILIVVPN